MPEGFAPLTPAMLDEHLEKVIQAYTLRGVPVLAHCRGGVGRAGLVACCWMLKLGLCGWKDPELCSRTHTPTPSPSSIQLLSNSQDANLAPSSASAISDAMMGPAMLRKQQQQQVSVCRATLQLVEKAIAVVRRRRSLKAVETYEQVKFLVEFVEFLDQKAKTSIEHDID